MISDYDIATVGDLIFAKRWLYVASICYSAVGRLIKGLIIYRTHKEAPKSDNLIFLLNRLSLCQEFVSCDDGIRFLHEKDEYLDLVADLTFYHISDYPFSYQKINDRFIDGEKAIEIYNKALKIISWLSSFGA